MTGVRSGWGRASRSMRTKCHICQQVVVEFGPVSVKTDAVLGEASRDARLPAHSKMIPIIQLHLTISMLFLWDRPKA